MYSNRPIQVQVIVFAPCPLNKVRQDSLPTISNTNSTQFFISERSLLFHDFYLNFLYKCFLRINWNCLYQSQISFRTTNLLGIIRTKRHKNIDNEHMSKSSAFIQIFSPHHGTLIEHLCSLSFQFKMIEHELTDGGIVLLENVKLTFENSHEYTAHAFVHKGSKVKSIEKSPEHCDTYGLFGYSFIQKTHSSHSVVSRCSIFGEILFLFKDQAMLFIGLRCAKDTIAIVRVQKSLICLLKGIKLTTRVAMYDLIHDGFTINDVILDYVFDFDSKYAFREIMQTPQKNCQFDGHKSSRMVPWIFPSISTRTELLIDKWAKIVDHSIKFYEQELCS